MARERRRARFLDHFPDALDLIVRAVRAGLPVVEALLAVGRDVPEPVGGEFRHVSDQLQIGIPLEDALWQAADRLGIADFRIFVVSLSLQQETGGTLAEALNNLASVIRQRKGLRLKAKALSAEAKASALVISALPFFAGGALCIVNPDYVARFVSDPQGGYLLGAALAQITLGILVMRFLIKRSVR
jgi:Flp pilus assembly protein TadB